MGELMKHEDMNLSPQVVEVVSVVVRDIMAPLMESIGTMLKHNTEAMEQIAAAQQMTSQRIADLEKRVRLQTPMSRTQEKYINDAIRARARELLEPKGFADDKKAVTKLGGAIRRSVLTRWGVAALREAPSYDYETALKQIGMWNDLMAIRDVMKEARKRAEMAVVQTERAAGADGDSPPASVEHQPDKQDMRNDLEG